MRDIRVLVVDDSKVGRLTLVKKLEPLGAQVDTAESGQEALDYLAQVRPDVIFMDHMMPDMDGFETTRRIKAAPATRDIPVIVVSGNEGDEFVQEACAAGAADAIVKPPAPGVLESILAALPTQVAEQTASAPAASQPIPEPVPVPPVAQPVAVPTPVSTPDRATVHAWVESQVAGAMGHLRDELMADVGKTVEAASAQQRDALEEASERWRQHGDKTEAEMADLRRGAAEAADAGKQVYALTQRLQAVEAEMGKPLPDLDAVGQALQAQLEDHQALFEQRAGGLDSSLSTLSADVRRLSDEAQTAQAELERRIEALAQQAAHLEHAEPIVSTPVLDMDTLLAAMDERIAPRWAELREQLEAVRTELDGQGSQLEGVSLSQNTLQADLAAQVEALEGKLAAIAEPHEAARLEPVAPAREMFVSTSESSDAERPMPQQPAGEVDSRLQADLEQLKAKVKTLTLMLAIGGAVLLATIGVMLFRG